MQVTRREWLASAGVGMALAAGTQVSGTDDADTRRAARTPVIDVTDLYHPPQDPGDNCDLVAAYALPEIDLRAVIFDVTDRYRRPYVNAADHSYDDPNPGRDPGFIPVQQLNYLFNRNVPCAVGPAHSMRSPDDAMETSAGFEAGVDLMFKTLRESDTPVDVLSFGSARPVAVAYNRDPSLMRAKVRRVHLCAGAYPPGFVEWNVQLDPHAFVRMLRSDLPVWLYPCGGASNAYDLAQHNTFYKLPDLQFIRRMDPRLQQYLLFAFGRSARPDFLNAMDVPVDAAVLDEVCKRPHCIWETAVWTHAAGRKLVRDKTGKGRLVPKGDISAGDTVVTEGIVPGKFTVTDEGRVSFEEQPGSPCGMYRREDPTAYEAAARDAFADLYCSFKASRP